MTTLYIICALILLALILINVHGNPEKKLTGKQIFWCVVWAVVPVVNFFFMLLVFYAVLKQIKSDIDEYHGK